VVMQCAYLVKDSISGLLDGANIPRQFNVVHIPVASLETKRNDGALDAREHVTNRHHVERVVHVVRSDAAEDVAGVNHAARRGAAPSREARDCVEGARFSAQASSAAAPVSSIIYHHPKKPRKIEGDFQGCRAGPF
jgi:hypothetical protein